MTLHDHHLLSSSAAVERPVTLELPLEPRPRLTVSALRMLPSTEPTHGVLDEVLTLRRSHWRNGHTPESDAAHGELFFTNGASHFLQHARHARSPEKMRHHRIAAIAMLVALVDREDWITRSSSSDSDRTAENATRPIGGATGGNRC